MVLEMVFIWQRLSTCLSPFTNSSHLPATIFLLFSNFLLYHLNQNTAQLRKIVLVPYFHQFLFVSCLILLAFVCFRLKNSINPKNRNLCMTFYFFCSTNNLNLKIRLWKKWTLCVMILSRNRRKYDYILLICNCWFCLPCNQCR